MKVVESDAEVKRLSVLAKRTNVETDIHLRITKGLPHRSESVELAHLIAAADQLFTVNALDFRFGYMSENGELLTYLLDILFEIRNAVELQRPEVLDLPIEKLLD